MPGTLTSAYLALRLCLGADFASVEVPFDQIIPAVVGRRVSTARQIDAGLIIHEGQLTYGDQDLQLVVDLGVWWQEQTGLPLPLGANAVRKDLGPEAIRDVQRLLNESIEYGLAHREAALSYALQYGRDLDAEQADQFVGMYVNDWTLDFGAARPPGRRGVSGARPRGRRAAGAGVPEFVT